MCFLQKHEIPLSAIPCLQYRKAISKDIPVESKQTASCNYISSNTLFHIYQVIGVDLGGAAGARAPPIIELVGQRYRFAPPIIQVRIFLNIETTSETKTRNLTTTRYYHNENNFFNYLHPIIFKIYKPSLSAKLTCRAY